MEKSVCSIICAFIVLMSLWTIQLCKCEDFSPDMTLSEDIRDNSIESGPVKNIGALSGKTLTLNLVDDEDNNKADTKDTCGCNQMFTKLILEETKKRCEIKLTLENKISELYEDLQQLKSLYIKEQEELMSKGPVQNTAAFSAQVTSHLSGLKHDETLVFSTILTNVGNCYDQKTGVFTATIPGTYLFSVTILSNSGDRIETQLMMSDDGGAVSSVAKLYSGGSPNRYGSGSNTVVLELNPQNRVWVQVYNGLGSFVFKGWSSFSGILISKRDEMRD